MGAQSDTRWYRVTSVRAVHVPDTDSGVPGARRQVNTILNERLVSAEDPMSGWRRAEQVDALIVALCPIALCLVVGAYAAEMLGLLDVAGFLAAAL